MILETPRLVLREFTEADADDANVYERDPEVVRYASHAARSLDESRAHIRGILEAERADPRSVYDFALVRREDGRLIGRCGFRITSFEQREAMLWYVLAASLRVAEKLGMRREAHFIENAFVKGEWTDSIIYGLLDREGR